MLKEGLNTYRQHIRKPELQQIDVEGHIRTCHAGNFKIMPFLQFRKTAKSKESHMRHIFFEKFKLALNKRHKEIIANVASTA